MLVGVDICNTIANVNYELLKRFHKLSLTQYPATEVPKDFFTSVEGLKLFQKTRPFLRANEVLQEMVINGYQIIYITSRPKIAQFITQRWLKLNWFPTGRVEFVPSTQKAAMARDAGMVAFFEDDPLVLTDLIQKGVPNVFIKSAPYNRHIVGPNLQRFTEWSQLKNQKPLITVRV